MPGEGVPFKKKNQGRPLGSKNKIPAGTKQAAMDVFEQLGGVEAMVAWAKENQTEFYTRVFSKILPREVEVSGQGGQPIQIIVQTGVPHPQDGNGTS